MRNLFEVVLIKNILKTDWNAGENFAAPSFSVNIDRAVETLTASLSVKRRHCWYLHLHLKQPLLSKTLFDFAIESYACMTNLEPTSCRISIV